MINIYENIRRDIVAFFEGQGLDIVYVATAFMMVLAMLALKKTKEWNALDESERFLLRAVFFTAAVTVVVCILHIVGVF